MYFQINVLVNILNLNETITIDVVRSEQPGPGVIKYLFSFLADKRSSKRSSLKGPIVLHVAA